LPRLQETGMPKLAAHLSSSIRMVFRQITYLPPPETPAWKTEYPGQP
jgi:hypothetical protein